MTDTICSDFPVRSPVEDSPSERPKITLLKGRSRRLRGGHPWVFSNEIDMTVETKALAPGALVTLIDAGGERLGVATFNPHSLIAARLLDRDADRAIDAAFLADRLERAQSLRQALVGEPWYRLVHSEADGLPGLIVDRYDRILSVQVNTAGMERLTPLVLEALRRVVDPVTVVLRNDTPARGLEGLPFYDRIEGAPLTGPVPVRENGVSFVADLAQGQKTGWFYDQRDNRALVATLARGRRVLDLYTYAGGFAVQAARAGAASVLAVDRSADSLALAAESARLNGVEVTWARAEAFAEMARLAAAGERFGLVVADPPAFVKSRKDLGAGAKGYRKMARLAAALVGPGGFLFAASCSHHMPVEAFAEEIAHGIAAAGRSGRILRQSGAAADHPVHPFLPESAYLKGVLLNLD